MNQQNDSNEPDLNSPNRTGDQASDQTGDQTREATDFADEEVSKSQRKREAAEITRLGQTLASLSASELDSLGLDDAIRGHVEDLRKITSNGARKRQTLFLGKQLRAIDVDPIVEGLERIRLSSHAETRLLHLAESWRDRLLGRHPDGSPVTASDATAPDSALTAFLSDYPHADRQLLRQLIRNANTEHSRQKPPKSSRLLFRHIKETLAEAAGPEDPN